MQTFRTSISHDARVPNSCVQVPMRPYTAAVGAAASSWAMRRIVAASMPQAAATDSGAKPAASRRISSRPFT